MYRVNVIINVSNKLAYKQKELKDYAKSFNNKELPPTIAGLFELKYLVHLVLCLLTT